MNDDLGLVIKDNKVVVCSRDVARVFEREHRDVLKAIRNLGCSDEFRLRNFAQSTYTNEQNHEQPEYLLTRDGFVLLAMGFTGEKAMRFKEAYIAAFNAMEEELRLNTPNFNDPVAAARAWADAMEAKIALEGINKEQQLLIEEMKPKVYYTDTILQSNSLVQTTQIAKDYGMSARAFNKKLHELGVQYNTGSQWVLYQKYQDAGYAHSYTYEYTRPDGSHGTKMHLKWTQKGRLFLYNLLKDAGVLPVMEWE